MRASIILRNYNGKELLAQFLPSVMDAVRHRGNVDEVIVVDDGSADGSSEFVEEEYPWIRVIKICPNSGTSIIPLNVGVNAAKNDIIISLDNDVKVDRNFIAPLVKHFDKEDVFAVCSRIYNPIDGMSIESFNYPRFHKGRLAGIVYRNAFPEKMLSHPSEVWYAPGNSAAYDRRKFLKLGGYNLVFRPIYAEDVDICHKAWKRGWKTLCEPESITYHMQHSTVKKGLNKDYFEAIRVKNQFILTWKDLEDFRWICEHIVWTIARAIFSFLKKDFVYLRGLNLALKQIPEVVKKRGEVRGIERVFSDKVLFKRLRDCELKLYENI